MQVTGIAAGKRCKVQEESHPPESIRKIGLLTVGDNVEAGQQIDGRRVARLFGHLFGDELSLAIGERAAQRG